VAASGPSTRVSTSSAVPTGGDKISSAKLKQRKKRKLLMIAVALIGVALALGWWPLSLLLVALFYVANEVLLADHVFYDPRTNYHYQLAGETVVPVWAKNTLRIEPQPSVADTLLLQITVRADIWGRLLDPWIELNDGVQTRRQYFERGVGGCRYINLTAFKDTLVKGKSLNFNTAHCALDVEQALIVSFVNEALLAKRVLVIAPHADDAEIAAFGLYSQASDCTIVTVTAGETDAEQFLPWMSAGETALQAARFKGEVRSLDAVAAAIWGGVAQERCIALGYGCMQLDTMRQQPDKAVPSPYSGLEDTRPYRRLNRLYLKSDVDGRTSWQNLLSDLVEVVAHCRPELIVTAHPLLDKHGDHTCATRAIWQVVQQAQNLDPVWLLYANHLDASQDYPFGPAHSELGLPPHIGDALAVDAVYSLSLDADAQRRKALSLDLMHDLKRPVRAKKWLRKRLQRMLLRRPLSPYGEDDFFRKAVRSSEVFLVAGQASMAAMMAKLKA
jgi:LmbE family N-acetylglucosaminyl deacetylase